VTLVAVPDPPEGLTCAFGIPWMPWGDGFHCLWCASEALRLREVFLEGVASGVWDAEGYTPSERRILKRDKMRAGAVSGSTRR
jgi:hypothetical protein